MARRLTRRRSQAMCGGVAAGLAAHFDFDPVLARLGFVLLAFANGIGILIYIVCWVVVPPEEEPAQGTSTGDRVAEEVCAVGDKIAQEVQDPRLAGRGRMVVGSILIGLGSLLLLNRLPWELYWPTWLSLGNLWPLILMAIGLTMILRARREEA